MSKSWVWRLSEDLLLGIGLEDAVAEAVAVAYLKGLEDAAREADYYAKNSATARSIAAAIRAKAKPSASE
jgi:hypothetical protein